MEADEITKYLGSLAYWAAIAGIAIFVTKYAGPRQDIQILTYAVIAMAAVFVQWIIRSRRAQKNHENLEKENDMFVLSIMWSIMRRSLVSDHDKYCYEYGDINDTQRTIWMSDYDQYEVLCEKLHKKNGVMDSYRDDILELADMKEHTKIGGTE